MSATMTYGNAALRDEHPCQDRLRQQYATARQVWRDNRKVREIALVMGISERRYCDDYLALFPPLTWTSSSASPMPALDYDRAYREARP
jgi:hypothetical protein